MRHDSRMVMLIPLMVWLAIPGSGAGHSAAPAAVVVPVSPALPAGAQAGGRWPGAAPAPPQPLPEVGLRF